MIGALVIVESPASVGSVVVESIVGSRASVESFVVVSLVGGDVHTYLPNVTVIM